MNPVGLIVGAAGIFAICGAAFNWEWFMGHRKAMLVVKILGRTGARILYGLLGAVLVLLSVLLTMGIIK